VGCVVVHWNLVDTSRVGSVCHGQVKNLLLSFGSWYHLWVLGGYKRNHGY